MSKIGVNAPCPCGSGRKFKHCHGAVREPLQKSLDSELDAYQRAEARLDQLLMERVDQLCRTQGFATFLHAVGLQNLDEKALPPAIPPIWEYLEYEHRWEPGNDTAAFKELATANQRFDARQRALVSSHCNAPMSCFRITAVDPGVGIEVQDLLLDRPPFWVRERAGSRGMQVGNILFGRVGWLADLKVFRLYAAGGWLIEQRFEVEILHARAQRRPAGYENAAALSADALHWVLWYARWCERRLRPPQVLAPDGEPLEFHTLFFEIIDMQAMFLKLAEFIQETPEALADRATVAKNDVIEFAWLGSRSAATTPGSSGMVFSAEVDGRSVLGYFKIERDRLELTTNSRKSADRAKHLLLGTLQGTARYLTRRKRSLEESATATAARKPVEPSMSPADEAALIEPMLLNHYRAWLDIPVPALDGLTPREAFARPDRRSHVEALLRGLDTGAFAVPASVMNMLRKELGGK